MAEEDGDKREIEQQLERAVCSRVQHFKDQADSLTLESVRRLLEKDLGLEKFALDAHKRFIRQYLEKKMEETDDCNSKPAVENVTKDVHLNKEEATTSPKQHETKNNSKKSNTGDEEMMEDSPIMGVLSPKSEVGSLGSSVSESLIEKAITERADYFLANTDLTLAGVRRLLEEDLGLEKGTLDPFKKFISKQIDLVLNSPDESKSAKDVKKKAPENLKKKKSEAISSDKGSDFTGSESEEMENKVKSRKEAASKRNIKKVEQPKKRKIPGESDSEISGKKQKKNANRKKDEDDSNGDGSLSEDGQSQSSVEKAAQRKEKSAPGYSKQVENLKSIIKACGMSVAPSIYKKAKQVPENKREAVIVNELESILSREGLSRNPTEKEIRDCRKRKETARELEGIDMSNIISSSRRRSTFSFASPPVKPEIRPKKDKVDAKEEDKSKDNNEKNQSDDNEEVDKKEEKKDKEEETEERDEDEEEEEEEEDDESEEFNEDDNEESD